MAFLPVSPWSVGNDLKCLLTDGSLIPFQRLAELLKSKKPEDLQEANRLIKNMVKEVCESQKWLLYADQYVIAVFERHLTQNDGDPFLKQELLHTGCITNEKHTNAKLFQSAIITPASTWFFDRNMTEYISKKVLNGNSEGFGYTTRPSEVPFKTFQKFIGR